MTKDEQNRFLDLVEEIVIRRSQDVEGDSYIVSGAFRLATEYARQRRNWLCRNPVTEQTPTETIYVSIIDTPKLASVDAPKPILDVPAVSPVVESPVTEVHEVEPTTINTQLLLSPWALSSSQLPEVNVQVLAQAADGSFKVLTLQENGTWIADRKDRTVRAPIMWMKIHTPPVIA